MKWVSLLILAVFAAIPVSLACNMMYAPENRIMNYKEFCMFDWHDVIIEGTTLSDGYDVRINKTLIRDICTSDEPSRFSPNNLSVTEEDWQTIFLFLKQDFEDDAGADIRYERDEEYQAYKTHWRKVNLNICDCTKMTILGREDGWTSYRDGTKRTCSFSPACYQPPWFCPNSVFFSPFLVLLAVFGILCVLLVLLIKLRISSVHKK